MRAYKCFLATVVLSRYHNNIIILYEVQQAPVTETEQCTDRLCRHAIANVGQDQSPSTEDPFDVNGGCYLSSKHNENAIGEEVGAHRGW